MRRNAEAWPLVMTVPYSRTARAQARFRIDAPNAQPRAITVVALDPQGETILRALMRQSWTRTHFLFASVFAACETTSASGAAGLSTQSFSMQGFSMQTWLADLNARVQCLLDELEPADIVMMVSGTGDIAAAAGLVGDVCQARHAMTTAMVVADAATSDERLSAAMTALRPFASMIVVGEDEEGVRAMLAAFGADVTP